MLELVHAVKFRSSIPDTNLQSVLQVHHHDLEQFSTYIHAFAARFMFSRPCYWFHVSRACHWLLVFQGLPLVTCFPAPACSRHMFPSRSVTGSYCDSQRKVPHLPCNCSCSMIIMPSNCSPISLFFSLWPSMQEVGSVLAANRIKLRTICRLG